MPTPDHLPIDECQCWHDDGGVMNDVLLPDQVRMHDLDAHTTYLVDRWQDAHDATDRSAAQEAFRTGDVITMGHVIAEPHPSCGDARIRRLPVPLADPLEQS